MTSYAVLRSPAFDVTTPADSRPPPELHRNTQVPTHRNALWRSTSMPTGTRPWSWRLSPGWSGGASSRPIIAVLQDRS